MKEDIIAANLSNLRADIQALPQRIAEELQRNNLETSTPSQKLDDDNLTELISQAAENGGYPPTQNGDIRSLFWLFSLMALQN